MMRVEYAEAVTSKLKIALADASRQSATAEGQLLATRKQAEEQIKRLQARPTRSAAAGQKLLVRSEP